MYYTGGMQRRRGPRPACLACYILGSREVSSLGDWGIHPLRHASLPKCVFPLGLCPRLCYRLNEISSNRRRLFYLPAMPRLRHDRFHLRKRARARDRA